MNIKYFKYQDIDGDDITLEVNLDLLRVRALAIIYNFNGEVISRNKIVGWWSAKNKKKLINIMKNNIGNMSYKTIEKYNEFLDKEINNE